MSSKLCRIRANVLRLGSRVKVTRMLPRKSYDYYLEVIRKL